MAPSVRGEVSSVQHHHHHPHHPHQGKTTSEEPKPGFVKLATSQFEKNIYVHAKTGGDLSSSPLSPSLSTPTSASPLSLPFSGGDSSCMEDDSSPVNKSSSSHNETQQSNNRFERQKPLLDDDDQQVNPSLAVNELTASNTALNGHQQLILR